MILRFFRRLFCAHRWGNSNRLTRKHGTCYSRCRKCGASKRGM